MAFSSSHFLLSPTPTLPKPRPMIRCCSSSPQPPSSSSSSFDLRTYWTTLIADVNSHLDSAIAVRYPEKIFRAMRHAALAPAAKRAAPVMCIAAACDLLGAPRPAAFPAAAALEMVHAASLVHDDLPSFDASPSRRGLPSVHSLFGVDTAVLAGDALLPLALQHVATATPPDLVPASTVLRVLQEITRAVGSTGMAAGQFLDLGGIDAGNVVEVLEKKFGELAECAAACGGMLGGAQEEEVEGLRRYGRAVGVLYQLVDDVLMEEEKGVGQNGDSGAKMRSNASVVKVMGMDRAMEMVEELRTRAHRELDGLEKKYGERVMPLRSFVDYAVERGFVVAEAAPAVI